MWIELIFLSIIAVVFFLRNSIVERFEINKTLEELDKEINSSLTSLENTDIYNDYNVFKKIPKGTALTNYIDPEEESFILSLFIQKVNKLLNKEYIVLSVSNTQKQVEINNNQKDYKFPIFLYNKTDNFTKRIILYIHTELTNLLKITVKNIELPKDLVIQDLKQLEGINLQEKVLKKYEIGSVLDDYLITQENISNEEKRQKLVEELSNRYYCFGIPDADKIPTKEECNSFGGVWDREAKTNEECPFYLANKNYTNLRGRSRYGYCELPVNMKNIGYTRYSTDPLDTPVCYNCPKDKQIGQGTLGICCEEQKNNPSLITPDYAFSGDQIERSYAKEQLKLRNLEIS